MNDKEKNECQTFVLWSCMVSLMHTLTYGSSHFTVTYISVYIVVCFAHALLCSSQLPNILPPPHSCISFAVCFLSFLHALCCTFLRNVTHLYDSHIQCAKAFACKCGVRGACLARYMTRATARVWGGSSSLHHLTSVQINAVVHSSFTLRGNCN